MGDHARTHVEDEDGVDIDPEHVTDDEDTVVAGCAPPVSRANPGGDEE